MSEPNRRRGPAPVSAEEREPHPEVVVLVGLQASGKSTLFRTRFSGTHALVSRDLFRNNRRPGRRQRELVEEALSHGRSVVVDNTNPTVADRAAVLEVARAHGARTACFYLVPDVGASLARNARREGRGRVPVPAILATRKRLEPPSLAEGFDRLFEVEPDGQGGFRIKEVLPGTGAGAG